MPNNSDRKRRVAEAVATLREHGPASLPNEVDGDAEFAALIACENVPEILALAIAKARANGHDETEVAEVLLKCLDASQEELCEWAGLFDPLGYCAVAKLMKRMARRAPSRPRLTVLQRMAAKKATRMRERAMRSN